MLANRRFKSGLRNGGAPEPADRDDAYALMIIGSPRWLAFGTVAFLAVWMLTQNGPAWADVDNSASPLAFAQATDDRTTAQRQTAQSNSASSGDAGPSVRPARAVLELFVPDQPGEPEAAAAVNGALGKVRAALSTLNRRRDFIAFALSTLDPADRSAFTGRLDPDALAAALTITPGPRDGTVVIDLDSAVFSPGEGATAGSPGLTPQLARAIARGIAREIIRQQNETGSVGPVVPRSANRGTDGPQDTAGATAQRGAQEAANQTQLRAPEGGRRGRQSGQQVGGSPELSISVPLPTRTRRPDPGVGSDVAVGAEPAQAVSPGDNAQLSRQRTAARDDTRPDQQSGAVPNGRQAARRPGLRPTVRGANERAEPSVTSVRTVSRPDRKPRASGPPPPSYKDSSAAALIRALERQHWRHNGRIVLAQARGEATGQDGSAAAQSTTQPSAQPQVRARLLDDQTLEPEAGQDQSWATGDNTAETGGAGGLLTGQWWRSQWFSALAFIFGGLLGLTLLVRGLGFLWSRRGQRGAKDGRSDRAARARDATSSDASLTSLPGAAQAGDAQIAVRTRLNRPEPLDPGLAGGGFATDRNETITRRNAVQNDPLASELGREMAPDHGLRSRQAAPQLASQSTADTAFEHVPVTGPAPDPSPVHAAVVVVAQEPQTAPSTVWRYVEMQLQAAKALGQQALAVDVDFRFAALSAALGLTPRADVREVQSGVFELDDLVVRTHEGYHVLPAQRDDDGGVSAGAAADPWSPTQDDLSDLAELCGEAGFDLVIVSGGYAGRGTGARAPRNVSARGGFLTIASLPVARPRRARAGGTAHGEGTAIAPTTEAGMPQIMGDGQQVPPVREAVSSDVPRHDPVEPAIYDAPQTATQTSPETSLEAPRRQTGLRKAHSSIAGAGRRRKGRTPIY